MNRTCSKCGGGLDSVFTAPECRCACPENREAMFKAYALERIKGLTPQQKADVIGYMHEGNRTAALRVVREFNGERTDALQLIVDYIVSPPQEKVTICDVSATFKFPQVATLALATSKQ